MRYSVIPILLYQISALSALSFDHHSYGASSLGLRNAVTIRNDNGISDPVIALLRRALSREDKKIPLASSSSKSSTPSSDKEQTIRKLPTPAKAQSASKVPTPSNQTKVKEPNVTKHGSKQQVSSSKQNGIKPAFVNNQNNSSTKQKSYGNKNNIPNSVTAQSKTKMQGRPTGSAQNKAMFRVQQAKLKQPQRDAKRNTQPRNQKTLSEKNKKSGPEIPNPKPIKQKQLKDAALTKAPSPSQMSIPGRNRKPSLDIKSQKITKQITSPGGKLSKVGQQPKSKTSSLRNQPEGATSKQPSSKRQGRKLCKRGAGRSCLQSNESEMMTQNSSQRALMDAMYSGSGGLREHGRTTTRYIQDHKTKFGLDLLKQTAPVLGGAAACAGVCCKGTMCGIAASSVAASGLGGAAITAGCIGGVGPECYDGYKSYKAGTKAKAEEERRRTQERVGSLETRVQGTEQNLQSVQQGVQRSTTMAEAALETVETLQNEAIILPPVTQRIPARLRDEEKISPAREAGNSLRGRPGRGPPSQGTA